MTPQQAPRKTQIVIATLSCKLGFTLRKNASRKINTWTAAVLGRCRTLFCMTAHVFEGLRILKYFRYSYIHAHTTTTWCSLRWVILYHITYIYIYFLHKTLKVLYGSHDSAMRSDWSGPPSDSFWTDLKSWTSRRLKAFTARTRIWWLPKIWLPPKIIHL